MFFRRMYSANIYLFAFLLYVYATIDVGTTPFTDNVKNEIVDAHNELRRRVADRELKNGKHILLPPAADMNEIVKLCTTDIIK